MEKNQFDCQQLVKKQKHRRQLAKLRAKKARQKKKRDIEYLESRIQELQIQNTQLRKQLSEKSKACQFCSEQQQKVKQITEIQTQFAALHQSVQQKNENKSKSCLEKLKDNFGVSGKQRKQWIQSNIKSAVQLLMPMHCRLFLEHCENKDKFYDLMGTSKKIRCFGSEFFDQRCRKAILESRQEIYEARLAYQRIIRQIGELVQSIENQGSKLQSIVDKFQSCMNPILVGRILLDLDTERKHSKSQLSGSETPLSSIFPMNFYCSVLNRRKQRTPLIEQLHFQMFQSPKRQFVNFNDDQNYLNEQLDLDIEF